MGVDNSSAGMPGHLPPPPKKTKNKKNSPCLDVGVHQAKQVRRRVLHRGRQHVRQRAAHALQGRAAARAAGVLKSGGSVQEAGQRCNQPGRLQGTPAATHALGRREAPWMHLPAGQGSWPPAPPSCTACTARSPPGRPRPRAPPRQTRGGRHRPRQGLAPAGRCKGRQGIDGCAGIGGCAGVGGCAAGGWAECSWQRRGTKHGAKLASATPRAWHRACATALLCPAPALTCASRSRSSSSCRPSSSTQAPCPVGGSPSTQLAAPRRSGTQRSGSSRRAPAARPRRRWIAAAAVPAGKLGPASLLAFACNPCHPAPG